GCAAATPAVTPVAPTASRAVAANFLALIAFPNFPLTAGSRQTPFSPSRYRRGRFLCNAPGSLFYSEQNYWVRCDVVYEPFSSAASSLRICPTCLHVVSVPGRRHADSVIAFVEPGSVGKRLRQFGLRFVGDPDSGCLPVRVRIGLCGHGATA